MSENIFKISEVKVRDNTVTIARPKLKTEILYEEEERKKVLRELLLKEADEIKEAQANLDELQKEASEIIGRSEKKAEEIIINAEKKAEEILVEAEKNSKKILDDTNEEKERLINEAKNSEEEIKGSAHKEGYDAGYKEGYEKISSEALNIINKADEILKQIFVIKKNIIDTSREDILKVVESICKLILHKEVKTDKEILYPRVVYALNKLSDRDKVLIKMNPDTIPEMEGYREELFKDVRGLDHLVFKKDSSLEIGDIIIETDFGKIDSKLDSEIKEVIERLSEIGLNIDYVENIEKEIFGKVNRYEDVREELFRTIEPVSEKPENEDQNLIEKSEKLNDTVKEKKEDEDTDTAEDNGIQTENITEKDTNAVENNVQREKMEDKDE